MDRQEFTRTMAAVTAGINAGARWMSLPAQARVALESTTAREYPYLLMTNSQWTELALHLFEHVLPGPKYRVYAGTTPKETLDSLLYDAVGNHTACLSDKTYGAIIDTYRLTQLIETYHLT